jgi:hypothetical protein
MIIWHHEVDFISISNITELHLCKQSEMSGFAGPLRKAECNRQQLSSLHHQVSMHIQLNLLRSPLLIKNVNIMIFPVSHNDRYFKYDL